jgi:hypothetical protein
MPTTVVSSIGSGGGRDYSTMQAWEDACPANLVSVDQVWEGQCYNDSEFTAQVSIGGITTDATRYVHLTAAPGQSFQDQAGVRTTALRYAAGNGVALKRTAGYQTCLSNTVAFTRVSRLQIESSLYYAIDSSASMTVSDCVVVGGWRSTSGSSYTNCVMVDTAAQGNLSLSNSTFHGCSFVRPIDLAPKTNAFTVNNYSGTTTITSCAVFGFTNVSNDNTKLNGVSSATSAAAFPGTSNQVSVTYTAVSPFRDADKDSLDLRAVDGSALSGAGVIGSASLDISLYTRANPPTVGAWERAGGVAPVPFIAPTLSGYRVGPSRVVMV